MEICAQVRLSRHDQPYRLQCSKRPNEPEVLDMDSPYLKPSEVDIPPEPICAHCNIIPGVHGYPSYEDGAGPFEEGDPMAFCDTHMGVGIAYRLGKWIEKIDHGKIHEQIMHLTQQDPEWQNQATQYMRQTHQSMMASYTEPNEFYFRTALITAILYEYLPKGDALLLLHTKAIQQTIPEKWRPLREVMVQEIYTFVSGERARKPAWNHTDRCTQRTPAWKDTTEAVGIERWPARRDGWEAMLATNMYYPMRNITTWTTGDYEAIEYLNDTVRAMIHDCLPQHNEETKHHLRAVLMGPMTEYFLERCACSRLLTPGQTNTAIFSYLTPRQYEGIWTTLMGFWPCGHTYEIIYPQMPEGIEELTRTVTQAEVHKLSKEAQERIIAQVKAFRRRWMVQERQYEENGRIPRVYRAPAVMTGTSSRFMPNTQANGLLI